MGKITQTVQMYIYTQTWLLLAVGRVFADDSPWAKHKANGIPPWLENAFFYYILPAFIFFIIFFILPAYVIRPFLDRRQGNGKET